MASRHHHVLDVQHDPEVDIPTGLPVFEQTAEDVDGFTASQVIRGETEEVVLDPSRSEEGQLGARAECP